MSVKDYKLLRLRFTTGERRIFIGLLVAATSQLYHLEKNLYQITRGWA